MTGISFGNGHSFIECSSSGLEWNDTSMFGDIFPTLHVAAVIMHAVIIVIVFYRFPRKLYYPTETTIFIYSPPKLAAGAVDVSIVLLDDNLNNS